MGAQAPSAPANPTPFNRGQVSSYDGSNRGGDPLFGTHPIPLVRLADARYMGNDGQTPIGGIPGPMFDQGLGTEAPNVRSVSNIVVGNSTSVRNTRRPLNAYHTFWGQFMDHDLGLTEGVGNDYPIDVTGDATFNPTNIGGVSTQIPFGRAIFENDTLGVRQQDNDITAWIDSSFVYGEDDEKVFLLRGARCRDDNGECPGQFLMTPQGAYGTLPTTAVVTTENGGSLPTVVAANPVGAVPDDQIRVGGDIRAQENNALECMHTILVREHNRCAIQLADDNSDRTSDEIFEECRWFNMAYVQNILYAEYAPLLLPEVGMAGVPGRLGHNLDAVYQGYNSSASPNVFNEFSGALFRYGHSELPTEITRADFTNGNLIESIDLVDAFFNPTQTPTPESIDQILAGLWQDQQNEVDVFVIEDIRNQLFQNPADGGPPADLIAFNLQRSRDHGLPSLNQLRSALQLEPYDDFEDLVAGGNGMTPSAEQQIVADNLRIVYGDVANVELWIGGVAEPGFAGGNFGETLTFVVSLQYQNFRAADAYYYANGWFSQDEVNTIEQTVLSTLILRNSQVAEMPCQAMIFDAAAGQMMCQNMFDNGASSITFGVFTILATIAAFFF